MRRFWIIVAVVAIVLLVILMRGESYSTNDISNDDLAHVTYLGIFGTVVAAGVLGSGIKMTHVVRNVFIWIAIIFALVTGYNNRYELQDIAHNATAGMVPASPLSRFSENSVSVVLTMSSNGHFETQALVENQPLRFMIDTGASSVVISNEDASYIGIDTSKLNYSVAVNTANGRSEAAPYTFKSLKIGDIERENVRALIAKPGALRGNLLGMSFLSRLAGYSIRADKMFLVD